jgi:hypothetical protein
LENYAQLKAGHYPLLVCTSRRAGVDVLRRSRWEPDGFQVDSYGSNDEANAFMAGPHFAANPIGVECDPDEWLARVRAGTPGISVSAGPDG